MKISGVLMQAWNEAVFKLLRNCVGKSLEVDRRTANKEFFVAGRVKVIMNRSLPVSVALWVEDIRYAIHIVDDNFPFVQGREEDQEEADNYLAELHLEEEDADVIRTLLKEEVPAQGYKVFGKGRETKGDGPSRSGQVAKVLFTESRTTQTIDLLGRGWVSNPGTSSIGPASKSF